MVLLACLFLTGVEPLNFGKPFVKPRVNFATLRREDQAWLAAYGRVEKGFRYLQRNTHIEKGKVVRTGPVGMRQIALTFDDGPHGDRTRELLKLLRETGAKGTFFIVGKVAARQTGLLKEIAAEGNELGNHTYSHVDLKNLSSRAIFTEYLATNQIVFDAIGKRPEFCRPPGGQTDFLVVHAAGAFGMKTAMWTCDPADYMTRSSDELLGRLRDGRKNGAIYLLHDGVTETVEALRTFIPESRAMGYRFVVLSDWLGHR